MPAQQVFVYWEDFRNFQQFIPIIEIIEILDDKRSRWIIHAPLGHKVLFKSLITTFEPGKKLVWGSGHADGYVREGTLMGSISCLNSIIAIGRLVENDSVILLLSIGIINY